LQWLEETFGEYIADRRANPRDDILGVLASTKYPDGAEPEIIDVVRPATFLFAAGQETVTKLLSAAVRVLAERPELPGTRHRGDVAHHVSHAKPGIAGGQHVLGRAGPGHP
jgi:cytochrome P450